MDQETKHKHISKSTDSHFTLEIKAIVRCLERKGLPQEMVDEILRHRDFGIDSLYDHLRHLNLRSSRLDLKNFGNKLRDLGDYPVDFDLNINGVVRTYTMWWFGHEPLSFSHDFDWDNDYTNDAPPSTAVALLTFSDAAHVIFPVGELSIGNTTLPFSVVWNLRQQKFWIVYDHSQSDEDLFKLATRSDRLPGLDDEISFGVLEGLDLRWGRQATLSEFKKEGWSLWPALRIEDVYQISPAALGGINEGIRAGIVIPDDRWKRYSMYYTP